MSLRRAKQLRCFYCNKSQGKKLELGNQLRKFDCPSCNATNWLDENGDITDPPVEATTSTSVPQYARPFRASASVEPQNSIFCKTCLKNQHLFTSSLAQYLPSDPNDPEYAILERNYYTFRANLEKRYPQICAACEPKVAARVKQARYTAKTDYLRRMMEQSRANRYKRKGITSLDVAHKLGKMLWWGGVIAQALWHIRVLETVSRPMLAPDASEEDGIWFYWPTWLVTSVRFIMAVARILPGGNDMLAAGLVMSLMTLWWNPRFPQVFRGFAKPVLGLSSWYSLQALILAARFGFPHLDDMEVGRGDQEMARLCVHTVAAIIFIYALLSSRCVVCLDTTPLFGNDDAQTTFKSSVSKSASRSHLTNDSREGTMGPEVKRAMETTSLSSILDDILTTPVSTPPSPISPTSPARRTNFTSPGSGSPVCRSNFGSMGTGYGLGMRTNMQARILGTAPRRFQTISQDDSDAMDWSPTQPAVRPVSMVETIEKQEPPPALRREPENRNPFAPKIKKEELTGPFWFKVPPAPKPPVQKYLSQQAAAIKATGALQQSVSPSVSISFDSAAAAQPNYFASSFKCSPLETPSDDQVSPFATAKYNRVHSNSNESYHVQFAEPRFFAPISQNDPRTDLVSMLNRSFSLGPDEGDSSTHSAVQPTSPTHSTSSIFSSPTMIAKRAETLSSGPGEKQQRVANPFALQILHSPLAVPLLLVFQVFLLWVLGLSLEEEAGRLCQMAALGLLGVMAMVPVWTSVTSLVSGLLDKTDSLEMARDVAVAMMSVGELAGVGYYLGGSWVRDERVEVSKWGSLVVLVVLGHHVVLAMEGRDSGENERKREREKGRVRLHIE